MKKSPAGEWRYCTPFDPGFESSRADYDEMDVMEVKTM